MRGPARAGVALAIAAGVGAVTVDLRAQTFRSTSGVVPLYVTVTGPDGRLVTGLTRDDFTILDNGREQRITLFDNSPQPISIVIMLDMSGSMMGNLPVLRQSAVQLFTRLRPDDRARVGNFGDTIRLSPAFTNDVNDLIRALWLDLEPGGSTPLWRAVSLAMSALAEIEGRRVVLVLSDGKDSGWELRFGEERLVTFDEVVSRAQAEEVMVYGIGMRSRRGPGGGRRQGDSSPDPGLHELAARSGGGYFELDGTEALGPIFAKVADELHGQYLIGFVPPERDGAVHEVDVRVRDASFGARARRSYVAPGGAEVR